MRSLLSKLNAKSVNMLGAGGGAHGGLSMQDVAGALGRCSDPLASSLLRAKFAGQNESLGALAANFEQRLAGVASLKGWKMKSPDMIGRLARGAISEFCFMKCDAKGCGGRGHVQDAHGVIIECPTCNGTGMYRANDDKRAAALGIARVNYKKSWEERWEFAVSELSSIEKNGLCEAIQFLG